jgi:hypothetical protein
MKEVGKISEGELVCFTHIHTRIGRKPRGYKPYTEKIIGTVVKVNRTNMVVLENEFRGYEDIVGPSLFFRRWTVWKNYVRRYKDKIPK